jgi:hypothetical protein
MIRLKVRVLGFRDYQTTWRTHWALLWLRNLSFHRGRGRKDSRGPIKGSLLILSTSSLPRRHRHSFIYLHRTATMHMQVHPFMEWGRRTFLTALRGMADNAYIYRSMCFRCDAGKFGTAHTCLFDERHCPHLHHPLPCNRQPTGAKHSCRRAPYRPVILPAPSRQPLEQRRLVRKALPRGRPRGVRGSSLVSGSRFRVEFLADCALESSLVSGQQSMV